MNQGESNSQLFITDVPFLSSIQNIDSLPVAMSKVLADIREYPERLTEELLVAMDNVICLLGRDVIFNRFNMEGTRVFMSGVELADRILAEVKNPSLKECYKWRWGMAFDMADVHLSRMEVMIESDRLSYFVPERFRLSLQALMKPNEKGVLTTVEERVYFRG